MKRVLSVHEHDGDFVPVTKEVCVRQGRDVDHAQLERQLGGEPPLNPLDEVDRFVAEATICFRVDNDC